MRRLKRLRDDSQRGARAVMVAILMMALLIGGGAIAIDVGMLWKDRKELQNGADAAALALALECSKAGCPSPSTTPTDAAFAAKYAAVNYDQMRPSATCTDDGVNGGICVTWTPSTVRVTVWDFVRPNFPFFTMLGFGQGKGKLKVGATAEATWRGGVAPMIMNKQWVDAAVGADRTFSICPDVNFSGTWPTQTGPAYLPGTPGGWCENPAPTSSGNFFFLETTDACYTPFPTLTNSEYYLQVSTGNGPKCDFRSLITPGNIVYFPFTTESVGTGSTAWYKVAGYGQWKVLGYCLKLPNSPNSTQGAGTEQDKVTVIAATGCEARKVGSTTYSYPLRLVLKFQQLLTPEEIPSLGGKTARLVS